MNVSEQTLECEVIMQHTRNHRTIGRNDGNNITWSDSRTDKCICQVLDALLAGCRGMQLK